MRKKLCNKSRKTWKPDFFRQIEGIPINPLNHVYCFIFKNQSYTRNFYMNVNNAFNALKKIYPNWKVIKNPSYRLIFFEKEVCVLHPIIPGSVMPNLAETVV